VGLLVVVPVALVLVVAVPTLQSSPGSRFSGAPGASRVLVHYRGRTVYRPAATSGASYAYEIDVTDVWVSGARRHRVETDYVYSASGRPEEAPMRLEVATDGRRTEHFQSGSVRVTKPGRRAR
jgi:hypothetical protein